MNTVSLKQFQKASDMETFRAAAEYLRSHPGTVLQLEKKVYTLSDDDAIKLQKDVMAGKYGKNHEPKIFNYDFPYKIGIDLKGARDIKIAGNGAALVFDGFMENISCQLCENVEISDITIDLKRKAFSRGKIVKSGKILGLIPYMNVDFGGLEYVGAKMPKLRILVEDSKEKWFKSVTRFAFALRYGKGKYCFVGSSRKNGGDYVNVTNTYHFRPSILIYEAINTRLKNITIHSHCGMGIVGHRSHDILISGLKVIPSLGYTMSTNTDATHFTSCTGLLRIENSEFFGHGDDAINVHTYYHTVKKCDGGRYVLEVRAPTGTHCQKLDYFSPGDTVELCKLTDLTPTEERIVKSVTPDFENHLQIVAFDRPLPAYAEGWLLADVTQLPRLEFVNNTVKNHLARAVLVKTRNVLIENNILEADSFCGIQVAAEAWWHEGVTCRDAHIRNNKISRYGVGIDIGISAKTPTAPVHRNIVIEDNDIDAGKNKYGIVARCVDGLTVRNNRVKTESVLHTEHCINVNKA